MNCEDVEQKIPLLCGDDLPPEANRERLMDHIDRCASCRDTLMEYQESREVLQHMKEEGMPDDFWASFQQDLDAQLADLPSPSRGSTSTDERGEPVTDPSSSWRTALVAAAMLLIGLGLGYFGQPLLPEYGADRTTPTESVGPDTTESSEPTSDDVAPADTRPLEDRTDTRSVHAGQNRDELYDLQREEQILYNPMHELERVDRREARASE
jgi:hypothetical protein